MPMSPPESIYPPKTMPITTTKPRIIVICFPLASFQAL
jgi:hypothetical protein